ncbi:tRNA (guanine(46)-N(7))-methyltransferase [Entamoeba marina]
MFNNDNPVNIELCSGYGEWLITRAKDNLNENWVGVELYRDRVYNSWASKTFAGLNNVGCVWGDAIAVLMLCLMPNTVDKIYLNFPEPPKYENSPTNLFTSQMFFQIARVLKLDGEFMLLTDSPVVVSIIEKVFTHTPLLNNKFQSQGRDFFVKKMPQNYGTSYFDQLWKNGKINQDRFFMHIKKIA